MQLWLVAVALAGLVAVATAAAEAGGPQLAVSVAIGALGGLGLYHASFGFTGAWRRLVRERRGAGVRAQLLMLAVIVLVSYPMIGLGVEGPFGTTASGWVSPIGLASAFGALVFGIGMQLGGGCGSGTLFTVGGGSTRMLLTLAAFVAGSLLWTGSSDLWSDWPRFARVSLIAEWGWPLALAVTLGLLAALAGLSLLLERARHGAIEAPRALGSLWAGPWPLALGALVLAAVVIACFLVLGRPWGITAAFPLWGAKVADGLGLPVADWPAWRDGRIERSVFAGATSVMNFGVMLGALTAAGLAGRFAPSLRLSPRDLATAVIGGLMMGYGARLAYGCNIGGLVGGVASASLHGWWWLIFGFLGSLVGVRLRRLIGMDPPAPA